MIRGSDGLDYEDLGTRLLGEPADTGRNKVLGPGSHHDEAFRADYREAYSHYEAEGYTPEVCHRSGFAQATFSEEQRHRRVRAKIVEGLQKQCDDRVDALRYAYLTGGPVQHANSKPKSSGTIDPGHAV